MPLAELARGLAAKRDCDVLMVGGLRAGNCLCQEQKNRLCQCSQSRDCQSDTSPFAYQAEHCADGGTAKKRRGFVCQVKMI